MIGDRDIWASALLMLKQHSDDAVIEAAMKADQMLDNSVDFRGRRTYFRPPP